MKIDRHSIDSDYMKDMPDRFERRVRDLPSYVQNARRDPKNLSLLVGEAHAAVAFGCVVDAHSPMIPNAMKLAADASLGLFLAAANPRGVQTTLGGESVAYSSPPDESTVHVGRWIRGFYFNVLAGSARSVDAISQIPLGVVRKSSTEVPEYMCLYMEALEAFGTGRMDTIIDKVMAAVKATDPKRPDILDPDWTLYLDVSQLEVLVYVITKDSRFGEALTRAVERHKKYWGKSKDRKRDYEGYISVELTALAVLGQKRGLTADVESPYLPMHLAQ